LNALDRYKPSPDEGKLTGKVVIVTGSTQGLGEAFAIRSAYLGAKAIVICGRNREKGEQVASTLRQIDAESLYVEADLTKEQDCRKIVQACDERFGRVDGLVNSAGVSTRGTLDDTTVDLWDRLFALNVRAPFLLIQEATRIMRREKIHGSIVNIITMASYGGEPVLTPYSPSKAALAVMTKNVAFQLQPYHIRVNGLNIGWTDTPGEHIIQQSTGQPADWLEKSDPTRPFGRLLRPEDISPMVTFLLSDLSSMVTGSVIDWDQTIHGPYGEHVKFEAEVDR
jgi:NAD(P)-dependent dehydrogenase (short-subunit alcohol dehydrogenase family)